MRFMDSEFTAYAAAVAVVLLAVDSFPIRLLAVLCFFSIIVLRFFQDWELEHNNLCRWCYEPAVKDGFCRFHFKEKGGVA